MRIILTQNRYPQCRKAELKEVVGMHDICYLIYVMLIILSSQEKKNNNENYIDTKYISTMQEGRIKGSSWYV